MEGLLFDGSAWKVGFGASISAAKDKLVNGKIPVLKSEVRLYDVKTWKVNKFIHPGSGLWDAQMIRLFSSLKMQH